MNVSKKLFLSNVNEWCWEGSGCSRGVEDEYGVLISEQVCSTYTAWLEEWVERFNAMEQGFKVKLLIEGHYYRIRRIIVKDIKFPVWDDIKEEEYVVEKKKAGDISRESRVDDDEEEEEEEDSESDEDEEEEDETWSAMALCHICWTKVEMKDCYNNGFHTKEVDKTVCMKCYAK